MEIKSLLTKSGIEQVCHIAEKAGAVILEYYRKDIAVETKSDNTPVTEADLKASELIVAALEKLTPEIPVLSEESEGITWSQRKSWSCLWLVDPLDGTKEFVKRRDEFTVNIALIVDSEPVLGVVYAPVYDHMYFAFSGHGAFFRDQKGQVSSMGVSESIGKPIRVLGSRSYLNDQTQAFLSRMGDYQLVQMGSSLKSCAVASGQGDLYPRLGPTSEWDTAAAQCIVEEAGGVLVNRDLKPLKYNQKESLLNPHFFVCAKDNFHWHKYLFD